MKASLVAGAAVLAAAALAGAVLLVRYTLAVVTVAGTIAELGIEAWTRY